MGDAFGQAIEEAKEELSAFKRQEDYLDSLQQAYTGLISSVTEQIKLKKKPAKTWLKWRRVSRKCVK